MKHQLKPHPIHFTTPTHLPSDKTCGMRNGGMKIDLNRRRV
jgi:hypothetical protein